MFHGWDNFFFMMGSAAAGLIGLLFIVVTLTSGADRSQIQRGQTLYMTPTAVHFAVVLTASAVALSPGLPFAATAAILLLVALVGLASAARAMLGIATPRPGAEPPHWSDFWMYGVTPTALCLALCAAALALGAQVAGAPHAFAALLLLLMLTGIRNAWDLVTWIAPKRPGAPN